MPAIAYVLDMNHRTNGAYGINEVILASALAAIVFPIFSVQPLTFVGVTGLINLVSNLPSRDRFLPSRPHTSKARSQKFLLHAHLVACDAK